MTEKLNQIMNSFAADTYVVVDASEFIESKFCSIEDLQLDCLS